MSDGTCKFVPLAPALLRAVSDRTSPGIIRGRAETEHLAGVAHAARDMLEAADTIAAEIRAGPESELGLALVRLRNLIGQGRQEGTKGSMAL
ncbi:MAG TPA: hypothetical protein VNB03_14710 [Casimicrobiaceae bacterium]|nr:hypothetical protein [Casimicrobiaceae bacterium]